jgi:vacuolar-type H+-ATPase subunit H
MAKEVWEEIQAAEAEARRIIEDAKLKSNNAIRDARQQALDMIALAEQKAGEEGEKLLAKRSVDAAADQKPPCIRSCKNDCGKGCEVDGFSQNR